MHNAMNSAKKLNNFIWNWAPTWNMRGVVAEEKLSD